jgi:hypothetical protein
MLLALLLAAALSATDEPADFAKSTYCMAIAEQASRDMPTLRRMARKDPAQLAQLDEASATWKRVGVEANRSAKATAIAEGKSPADQIVAVALGRRTFANTPPELRDAMADTCIYRFAREDWDRHHK